MMKTVMIVEACKANDSSGCKQSERGQRRNSSRWLEMPVGEVYKKKKNDKVRWHESWST